MSRRVVKTGHCHSGVGLGRRTVVSSGRTGLFSSVEMSNAFSVPVCRNRWLGPLGGPILASPDSWRGSQCHLGVGGQSRAPLEKLEQQPVSRGWIHTETGWAQNGTEVRREGLMTPSVASSLCHLPCVWCSWPLQSWAWCWSLGMQAMGWETVVQNKAMLTSGLGSSRTSRSMTATTTLPVCWGCSAVQRWWGWLWTAHPAVCGLISSLTPKTPARALSCNFPVSPSCIAVDYKSGFPWSPKQGGRALGHPSSFRRFCFLWLGHAEWTVPLRPCACALGKQSLDIYSKFCICG